MPPVPCARCRGGTRKRPNVDQWRCLQERGKCGYSTRTIRGGPERVFFETVTTARDAELESLSWLYGARIGLAEIVVHRPAGNSRSVEDVPIEANGRLFHVLPREEIGT